MAATTADEQMLQAIWTGGTNLAFVPVFVLTYQEGMHYECIIGFFTMVTSSLYHVCESLQVKFLGFNHGRWHHMDNVFAVTALLLNIANFAQGPRPSAFRELRTLGQNEAWWSARSVPRSRGGLTRNSLATSVVVCFQVASPWNLMHTILPLVFGFVLLLVELAYWRRLPSFGKADLFKTLLCGSAAGLCFYKGLDETKDYLRLWHGGWHLCVSAMTYFSAGAPNALNPGQSTQMYAPSAALGSAFSAMSPTSSPVSPQSLFDAIPPGNNQWVNTVMETAPFLDEQGIFQAVGILDEALTSVRHRKAIDAMVANANQYPLGMMNLGVAEHIRQQVQHEQLMLLQRLQLLHNKYPNVGGSQAPGFPPMQGEEQSSALFFMDRVPVAPGLNMPHEGESNFNYMPMMGAQQSTDIACQALTDAIGQQAACQAQMDLLKALSREIEAIKQVMAFAETRKLPEAPVASQTPEASNRLKVAFDLGADYKNDKTWKDPDKLIIVRRINKLGFKASRKLKQYFGEFGTVVRVLIAHSTCRDLKDTEGKVRQRPSSLGFVQLASAEAVRQALALGTEQEVEGAVILVQKFERQSNASKAEAQHEAGGLWQRWRRGKRFFGSG
eukprot:g29306.t1